MRYYADKPVIDIIKTSEFKVNNHTCKMEKTISHFQVEGLEIKLTVDKLYINTVASNEAFALRSIDGIGVIDLVKDFNESMNHYKKIKNTIKTGKISAFIGGVLLLLALNLYFNDNYLFSMFSCYFGIILLIIGVVNMNKKLQMPTLKSAVRIMMSGGNRDFSFDKADTNSQNIAEFVANVENTLTAFHKNN